MTGGIRRAVVVVTTMGVALVIGTGTAFAHIDPDPPAIESGTSATVSFGVEHGCTDSPTTGLDIKIPDGVTDAKAVDKDGWTTSVAAGVVSFSGGSLDAATPDDFSITFTAPAEAGTIYFPIVQKCKVGETAWIEIPAGDAAEPEHPAPAIAITDGPPTSADLAPAPEEATAETVVHHADGAKDDNDDSNTGAIVGIAIAVVVIGAGAAVLVTRRRKRS
jgi:periplasmic copper chaperone A